MDATRHDVVTRALRRRLRQNRRFDLEEAALVEVSTRRLLKPVPHDEIPLQLTATQIEIAMLQSQLLGGKLLALPARDGNRGSLSRSHDGEVLGANLDVARLHFRVSHFSRARRHFAVDDDDRLERKLACALDDFSRRPAWIEGDLDESGAVPEIQEDDAAEVAGSMNPPAQFHFRADVSWPELAAQVRSLRGCKARLRSCFRQRWNRGSNKVLRGVKFSNCIDLVEGRSEEHT